MFNIKQTKPIRRATGEEGKRPANLRYVYFLTAFVSIGALLFGYGKLTYAAIDKNFQTRQSSRLTEASQIKVLWELS